MSEIDDLYHEILGRDRDSTEKGSEEENASKYGIDSIRKNLEERKVNTPGEDPNDAPQRAPNQEQKNGGGGNSSAAGQSVINSWSQVPDTFTNAITEQNGLLKQLHETETQRQAQIAAEKVASDAKRDDLYGQLKIRAQQGENVSADDADIKMLVDPYRNEQVRARRNFISDTAESGGPLDNIRGETRMASEREGINTGNYQAQAMQGKLQAKRAEVADALISMRGILTSDQQANLQRELDTYDNQLSQIGAGMQSADAVGNLSLGYGNLASTQQLGNRGLDVQSQLGNRSYDLQALAQELQNRQFYDDLGLRTGVAKDNSNRWQSGF